MHKNNRAKVPRSKIKASENVGDGEHKRPKTTIFQQTGNPKSLMLVFIRVWHIKFTCNDVAAAARKAPFALPAFHQAHSHGLTIHFDKNKGKNHHIGCIIDDIVHISRPTATTFTSIYREGHPTVYDQCHTSQKCHRKSYSAAAVIDKKANAPTLKNVNAKGPYRHF